MYTSNSSLNVPTLTDYDVGPAARKTHDLYCQFLGVAKLALRRSLSHMLENIYQSVLYQHLFQLQHDIHSFVSYTMDARYFASRF